MHAPTCRYICICICVYVHMSVQIYVHTDTCIYKHCHTWRFISIFVYIYICTHACTYVHLCSIHDLGRHLYICRFRCVRVQMGASARAHVTSNATRSRSSGQVGYMRHVTSTLSAYGLVNLTSSLGLLMILRF